MAVKLRPPGWWTELGTHVFTVSKGFRQLMAIEVETKDCTQLGDAELAEMADLCADGPSRFEVGVLSKAAEGWVLVTLAMGLVFRISTSFGDTYGSLAGIVALQLWAMLSCMGILFGGAVAAQLEAVRAGVPGPQRRAADRSAPTGPTDEDLLVPATVPDVSVLSA